MGDALRHYTATVFVKVVMVPLQRGNEMLDLDVHFDEKLSFREHMHAKINKAYMMLGVVKRNFKYLTILTFVLLYNSMIRSHLD